MSEKQDDQLSPSPHLEKDSNSLTDSGKSIDHFLEGIGLGKYQAMVYAIVGIYSMCDGAEVIALSFINVVLKTEWGLSDDQISLIGSCLFAGFFFGSVVSGLISDNYGRKNIFLISTLGLVVVGNVSAFSPNYTYFLIFRTIYGFFIGILAPLMAVMIMEITEVKWRGRMFVIVSSLFTVGELMGWVVAYFTLSSYATGDWRILLMWVTIPALVSFVAGLFLLDESPRFLLFDDFEKGVELLNKMYKTNHNNEEKNMTQEEKDELQHYISRQKHSKQYGESTFSALFSEGSTRVTLLLWFMWFVLSFVYYGIIYIYPTVLEALNAQAGDGNDTDFYPVLMCILGEVPSYFLCYIMIEDATFGRQNSLMLSFFFAGTFCCGAYYGRNIWLTMDVFMAKFFAISAFTFVYPYTTELYHTKHRGTGLGFASGASRVGGIVMPWIAMLAYEKSVMLPFMIFGIFCILAAVGAAMMPYDTRGRELDKLDEKDEEEVQSLIDGKLDAKE